MAMLYKLWNIVIGMSGETRAAIIGGAVGSSITAISLGLIELIKWNHKRKVAEKAAKIGLYCEITQHHFLALDKDADGSPNYELVDFQNNFYKDNILDITKFLKEDMIYKLAFYYYKLGLALSYQDELTKYHSKLEAISACDPQTFKSTRLTPEEINEWNVLNQKRNDIKDVLRTILATAKKIREDLLADLKGAFNKDPSPLRFIDVLPEDQEWWQKQQKDITNEEPTK